MFYAAWTFKKKSKKNPKKTSKLSHLLICPSFILICSKSGFRGATESQVLIEPSNSLQESLLLGIFLDLDADIATYREAVLGAAV